MVEQAEAPSSLWGCWLGSKGMRDLQMHRCVASTAMLKLDYVL